MATLLADIDDEEQKHRYLDIIKAEANLEYWFSAKYEKKSVIYYLFDRAELKAKELLNKRRQGRDG